MSVDKNAEAEARARAIARVTWAGVGVNIFLMLFKIAGGLLAGSRALVADGVHSLSDLATDAVVLIGVRYWTAPADRDHPYGHQKIEMLVTLAIGLALAGVGLALGYGAARSLAAGAGGLTRLVGPDGLVSLLAYMALAAAALSLVSKELLFRWTAARGRAINSSALMANAWHHRSDAFSSIPPLISIGAETLGAKLGHDLWFMDPLGTLAVCVMLLRGAWEVVRPTFSTLLDSQADEKLRAALREAILSAPGALKAHRVRTRLLCAGEVAVDLHLLVDGNLTVTQGHDLANAVQERIMGLAVPGVAARVVDVVVQVEPVDEDPDHDTSLE